METLAQVNGEFVECKGVRFKLTMGDLAQIQQKLPISEDMRPFVSLTDVLKFCASPMGIDIAMFQAQRHGKLDDVLGITLTDFEKMKLVNDLIGAFIGDDGTDGAGEPKDPLAVRSETGS